MLILLLSFRLLSQPSLIDHLASAHRWLIDFLGLVTKNSRNIVELSNLTVEWNFQNGNFVNVYPFHVNRETIQQSLLVSDHKKIASFKMIPVISFLLTSLFQCRIWVWDDDKFNGPHSLLSNYIRWTFLQRSPYSFYGTKNLGVWCPSDCKGARYSRNAWSAHI